MSGRCLAAGTPRLGHERILGGEARRAVRVRRARFVRLTPRADEVAAGSPPAAVTSHPIRTTLLSVEGSSTARMTRRTPPRPSTIFWLRDLLLVWASPCGSHGPASRRPGLPSGAVGVAVGAPPTGDGRVSEDVQAIVAETAGPWLGSREVDPTARRRAVPSQRRPSLADGHLVAELVQEPSTSTNRPLTIDRDRQGRRTRIGRRRAPA